MVFRREVHQDWAQIQFAGLEPDTSNSAHNQLVWLVDFLDGLATKGLDERATAALVRLALAIRQEIDALLVVLQHPFHHRLVSMLLCAQSNGLQTDEGGIQRVCDQLSRLLASKVLAIVCNGSERP